MAIIYTQDDQRKTSTQIKPRKLKESFKTETNEKDKKHYRGLSLNLYPIRINN